MPSRPGKNRAGCDGHFVFVSYARENATAAARLSAVLNESGIDVFRDRRILVGDDHRQVIVQKLRSAACVVVLWSRRSATSDWVYYEARIASDRGILIEARLDAVDPPPPFGAKNVADLRGWKGGARSHAIRALIKSVSTRLADVNTEERHYSLAAPRPGQPITDSHLALVHTCWRTPDHDEEFHGARTYRWDIALYGAKQALDQVRSVTYYLHPAYHMPDGTPPSYAVNTLTAHRHRKTCFKLKQIANGDSLVRATVLIKKQTEPVILSRFINLFNSSDRMDAYVAHLV